MIPLIKIFPSEMFMLCLNEIVSLAMTRSDSIIYSLNNDFHIKKLPTFQMNLNEELELDVDDMPDMYIFDLDKYNLSNFISATYTYRFFNPRAKFVLAGSGIKLNSSEILISNFILNVIYLDRSRGDIFTIFPYDERMLQNPSKDWRKISSCADVLENIHQHNLFPEKIPKIWNNSRVRSMYVAFSPFMICTECEEKGSVLDILEESLLHLNVTVEYYEQEYNGSDFQDYDRNIMFEKKYEISLGEYIDIQLDYLYPHDYTTLYWVVPSPEEKPRWKYLFTVFSKQVWIIWTVTFSAICFTWFIMSLILSELANPLSLLIDAVTIIKMSLEQSASLTSRFNSESILFVIIYFFTWIMTVIYKSRFLYLLVGLNYEKIIDSVDDIMENNLTICSPIFTAVQGPFLETKTKEDYFNTHYIDCNFSSSVLFRLITKRDITFVDNDEGLNYDQMKYLDKDSRNLFHKINKPIISSQFGSTLIKGYPITEKLNQLFMFIDQHGIKKFIMSKYKKIPFGQSSNLQTQPLSISHVITAFYVLFLGAFLSVLSFCIEKLMRFL